MGEKRWTQHQKTAIELRGRTLLVSAAAGSGKTAVLTQRIISRLTDPEDGADITRMLIVTFTKAAAAELKERIAAALSDALASDPSNMRLAHQLASLGNAKISTIHSFCFSLIKRNFNKLGLSPTVRIADEAQALIMSKAAMNSVIDRLYDRQYAERMGIDFTATLRNLLSSDRDDNLADDLLDIYKKVSSYPEGTAYFSRCASELRLCGGDNFFDTSYGRVIKDHCRCLFSHAIGVYRSAVEYFEGDELFSSRYLCTFERELEDIEALLAMLDGGASHAEFSAALKAFKKGKLLGVKEEDKTPQSIYYCSSRTDITKKISADLVGRFFGCDGDELKQITEDTAYLCENIGGILSLYEEKLLEEKQKRSLVDYTDLERMAYSLLVSDGRPTDIARECALEFDEIYIDEYQDVNELQDAIFSSVSTNNRVMVGDIKQSIYAFRGAQPEVFNGYRESLCKYTEGCTDEGNTVFLSDNFRCDSLIIDFMNTVCSTLFTRGSSGISYSREDDDLRYAKIADEGHTENAAEVVILESDKENDVEREAAYVAQRMIEFNRSGHSFGEMAVLLRKKDNIAVFERVLSSCGIPVAGSVSQGFFEKPEILLISCILNSVDNPMRDVYLAGMMKSPFFGFTLDQLIYVRSFEREASLYEAVKLCSEEESEVGGKCRDLLCKLSEYRSEAEKCSADLLIKYIYEDLSMLEVAQGRVQQEGIEKAMQRRKNLIAFYDMARAFSASSYFGLYNFLQYIDEKALCSSDAEASAPPSDAVRIMTVHHSKGLEFPICFLSVGGHPFNKMDQRDHVIIGRECGIGIAIKKSDLPVRYDTPLRQAAGVSLIENSIEEEMRVLYVALTRAKERLIVTASSKDPQKLISECEVDAAIADRYTLLSCKSFIEWILIALKGEGAAADRYAFVSVIDAEPGQALTLPHEAEQEEQELPLPDDIINPAGLTREEYYALFSSRFSFEYPRGHLMRLPSKLTVSKLYPGILDEGDDGDEQVRTPMARPIFLEEEAAVSGADRGIATHVFMQFCDFERVEKHGVTDEIARLVSLGFISGEMAQRINIKQLSVFFEGELYKKMRLAPTLVREKRFNITVMAENFTDKEQTKASLSGEEILVQGVIDCFFENEDGSYTLVDYKTDSFSYADIKEHPDKVKAVLADRHKTQLSYYREALEKLSGRTVSKTLIYSFALGDCVEIV